MKEDARKKVEWNKQVKHAAFLLRNSSSKGSYFYCNHHPFGLHAFSGIYSVLHMCSVFIKSWCNTHMENKVEWNISIVVYIS